MDVKFITTTSNKLSTLPIVSGQLIYLSDVNATYYDMSGSRFCISSMRLVSSLPATGQEGVLYGVVNSAGNVDTSIWDSSISDYRAVSGYVATAASLGLVKPDGTTIAIDEYGTIGVTSLPATAVSSLTELSQLASDDYIMVLDSSASTLKKTALSNLGGKGIRACYDETTALYAHAVDDIVYVNSTLYKVTQAIAVGDTITVGTNVTADTDISENSQIYIENLPGSGGGGGSVDVDDELDPSSTNPLENQVITNTIAYTEASSTAAQAHAIGTAFIYNGQLVKATADINIGDTITVGTNAAVTTIAELISIVNAEAEEAYGNIPVNPTSTSGLNIWIETD